MTIVPFRNLAQLGILADPNPYELPPNAWSSGLNVRFAAGRAMRAPTWKLVQDALPFTPISAAAYLPTTMTDAVIMADITGRLWQYVNGTVTEVTPSGVASVSITSGGSGYAASSTTIAVTFSAATGQTAATGTATSNSSGVITSVQIAKPGNYPVGTTAPTITFPAATTTATGTVNLQFAEQNVLPFYSSCYLGEVLYVNNPAYAPVYITTSMSEFQPMPYWNSGWYCSSLRSFGDYLVALNVTKGGVQYPTMFKWSDTVLAGGPPDSWDSTNAATNAGENILEALESPIIDGLALRSAFVIYATNQVWLAEQTGTALIFNFSRIFTDGGIISRNCVVEVNGKHYVFGPYDIYVHDGVTKQSLAENRVKEFIFSNLNNSYSDRFFVTNMPQTNEILFAYVSADTPIAFPSTTGCNRGAVYNYAEDTWGFVDLPNVLGMGLADMNPSLTWSTAPSTMTWGNIGGTWYSSTDPYRVQIFGVQSALPGYVPNSRVLTYDFVDKGTGTFSFLPDSNAQAFLQRVGLDLDGANLTQNTKIAASNGAMSYTNESPSNLETYKIVKRVLPQITMFGNQPVTVTVGAQITPSGPVNWGVANQFNPQTDYKVDYRGGGRYLAFYMAETNPADFEVSGFDADIGTAGSR